MIAYLQGSNQQAKLSRKNGKFIAEFMEDGKVCETCTYETRKALFDHLISMGAYIHTGF